MNPTRQSIPDDTVPFRKTVALGLNAMTQNFLAAREQYIIAAAEEAGLSLADWMPNFETGLFISKKPPRAAPIIPDASQMHIVAEGIEP